MKINKISPTTSVFTERLSLIDDAPERLYYVGTLPETPVPVVAIVGTRKPTKYGTEVTQRIAYDLAKKGVVIVSGLALGVDALAHRAALEAGGVTVGVVINELPDISPRTNVPLAKQMIAQGGAVVSEWGVGDGAFFTKASFLRRNRLVSGLSDAIIITEAAAQSGTLNTAAHALAQGREVFVVPGNITSPLSEGCNNLLKQGATPITEARDVLEVIAPHLLPSHKNGAQTNLLFGDTPAETAILQLIATGVRDGEQLQQQSRLSAADFSTALTMLEINGLVKALGANQWTIR
jgi:DNA processing protein